MKPLKISDGIDRLTCLSYGITGSGKTEFLSTWPNPVIFAAAAEGGHITVKYMDRSKWYDPKWNPLEHVYSIATLNDFNSIVSAAKDEVNRGAKTIGLDTATFLVDLLVNNVSARGFDLWGEILAKMNKLRTDIYALGANVVWTAALDTNTKAPAMQGQTATILPHCCDLVLYHTAEEEPTTKTTAFRAWTSPKNGYVARHRFGNKLQVCLGRLIPAPDGDGKILKPEVSYRALEEALKVSA